MNMQKQADVARKRLSEYRGSFQDISKMSGLSLSFLSKYANGHKTNPTVKSLDLLVNTLDKIDRLQKVS